MRQQKSEHPCAQCGGPTKRTIGANSRKKFRICLDPQCGHKVALQPAHG